MRHRAFFLQSVSTLKTSFGAKPNVLQFCPLNDFYELGLLLTRKATEPRIPSGKVEVITSIYGRHYDLINHYGISMSHMTTGVVVITIWSFPLS